MDKASQDAVDTLTAMFSNIDKEMVADIFLGCKKNFDEAMEQLFSMGAELEKKPAPSKPTPAPVEEKKLTTPPPPPHTHIYSPPQPLVQHTSHVPQASAPNMSPNTPRRGDAVVATPPHTPVPTAMFSEQTQAEQRHLELLKEQLSQEYRRLADMQEATVTQDKQLSAKRTAIAQDAQKVEDDRRALEEAQDAFAQDKRRLEEHLSSRLREMKEQMRRNEEEARLQQEENRTREEFAREEAARAEAEERAAVKAEKRARKQAEKETRRSEKMLRAQQQANGDETLRASAVETALQNARLEFAEEKEGLIATHERAIRILQVELTDSEMRKEETEERVARLEAQLRDLCTRLQEAQAALEVAEAARPPPTDPLAATRALMRWLSVSVGAVGGGEGGVVGFKQEMLRALQDNMYEGSE